MAGFRRFASLQQHTPQAWRRGRGSAATRQLGAVRLCSNTSTQERPVFSQFETRAIHAGAAPDPTTGARVTPIFQNASFVFKSTQHAAGLFNLQELGNIYSRMTNPTVSVLEDRLANLEGGVGATCTSSGHAAQFIALLGLMQPGDRVVASTKLYGGSIILLGKTIKKFGWDCTFVDVDDISQVREALKDPKVKVLFAESLANPGGIVCDVQALADAAHEVGVPLIIDNTMATPWLCRPFEHGADIITHSTTKFLSGQGSALGGVVVDSGRFDWLKHAEKYPSLTKPDPSYHEMIFAEHFGELAFTMFAKAVGLRDFGTAMAPLHAFLTIQGCETLSVRMDRHGQNAIHVARFLERHPKVEWVSFAGLESSKYYNLCQKYMRGGSSGSVMTFGIKGGFEAGVKVVENVSLFSHLANIGDTRSLVLHPASTTHRQLTEAQRAAAGAGDNVIRLSVGLEGPEDLVADLEFALGQI